MQVRRMDHFIRSEVQMASRLAHNQEIVSSILTAAIFQDSSVVQQHDASLIRRKRWGGTTRSDFLSGLRVLVRLYIRLLIGEARVRLPMGPLFYCRAPHFSGLAEQQRHLFCKQAQTGAAPVPPYAVSTTHTRTDRPPGSRKRAGYHFLFSR